MHLRLLAARDNVMSTDEPFTVDTLLRLPRLSALRLGIDLKRNGMEAKFLYFPDEHHWIAKPNNARIWYETVLSFVDHYARGREWNNPDWL